jgi:CheY-like chemotaxis protein
MPRVLVIDDQQYVRTAISVALKANGFEFALAENADVGLKAFDAAPFDAVIVDIYMPGTDGTKTIRMLRVRAPEVPVVAISGMRFNGSKRTALDFFPLAPGLADVVCLPKPFKARDLIEAVQKAIGVPAQRTELAYNPNEM